MAHEHLGWRPVWSAFTMIERTAAWYQAWAERGELRTAHDLSCYVHNAREAELEWAQ